MTEARIYYENSQPILRVENMEAALHFYVDKLGFSNASWGTDDFTSVNRDRAGIYLCRGARAAEARGFGWASTMSRSSTRICDDAGCPSAWLLRNIPGLLRCNSKILMEMCCASGPSASLNSGKSLTYMQLRA